MSTSRFSNLAFKHMLDEKKIDISQRVSDGVQETAQFQRLLSLLAESRRKNKELDFRLILISKKNLLSLCDDADIKVKELFQQTTFLTNRTVWVDSDFQIRCSNNDAFPSDNNEARRYFTSLSETDEEFVVFHIAPNATIDFFINGHDHGNGIFYTREALNRYEELKPIEQLEEVLDNYRVSLTQQNTYLKFFVSKTGLRALRASMQSTEEEKVFLEKHKHLLNNRPEELFREDMRKYIQQHMRVIISREDMLENLDRLDIKLQDEMGRDLYLIEIKWVGESIHSSGQSFGTKYDASPRIRPDAIKQTLDYINQLIIEKENIKLGYLAVFDARREDMDDTGNGILVTDYPEKLRELFPRFVKLRDFRVKNINPR